MNGLSLSARTDHWWIYVRHWKWTFVWCRSLSWPSCPSHSWVGFTNPAQPKTCWLCPEKRSMVMAAAVFPCVTTAGLIWTSQLNDVGMDLVTSGPWQINGNGAACLLGGPFLILTLAGQVDNEVAWFNGSVVRKPAAKLWIKWNVHPCINIVAQPTLHQNSCQWAWASNK